MFGSFLVIEHLIPPIELKIAPRILALERLDIVMPSLMVVPVATRRKILATNITLKKFFTPVHPHVLDKISSFCDCECFLAGNGQENGQYDAIHFGNSVPHYVLYSFNRDRG